jgi:glyoxylase-like metal-dependent hydrolase (beta-lactamase superfamily II)
VTPYLEIGGDYREVAPGVWLAELPLPFSLGLINVYLIRLSDGWMLVDCGMQTAECEGALDRALEGIGPGWDGIRTLLLTHFHPDHMGLTERVLERSGATLWLHEADERMLAALCDEEGHHDLMAGVYRSAGVTGGMAAAIRKALAPVQLCFRPLRAGRRLQGGETFESAHGEWTVIHTPGHAPGHVCLHSREQRLLISGDHVLEHVSPNIGWTPGVDALGQYLVSLDGLAALDVDWILPSHGAPFSGLPAWIAEARRHHDERSANVLSALAGGPRTMHEIVMVLWTRELSPFHYRFALFEALAHLEHLRRRGRVAVEQGDAADSWWAVE